MSKVLMVCSEATPFAKTGGLADVLGALPPALVAQGHDVAVVLPRYRRVSLAGAQRVAENLAVWFGPDQYRTEIYVAVERGVPYFLVDCPPLYDRDGLYGENSEDYPDNAVRFAVLCRSALDVIRCLYRPQIVHGHDWQAALVTAYLSYPFANDPTFLGMSTILTIHNLGYQGRFGRDVLPRLGLEDALFTAGVMEMDGDVNFLKTGIQLADALTTVSPTYAREIQTPEYGFGLDALLRERCSVLSGIMNGADYEHWDPATDPYIARRYSPADLSGKRDCKAELLRTFGLPADDLTRPLIGIVSRFDRQKGFDLIEGIAEDLVAAGVLLVALGTGEPHYEQMFQRLAADHPASIAVRIAFDESLAHQIEAGADMFLMPSHYEPAGLNQLYSLRYATVPIVRATGGLEDSIDAATGFKFAGSRPEDLIETVREALAVWNDPPRWRRMMLAGMAKDFSWKSSAAQYSMLYHRLTAPTPEPAAAHA